MFYGTCRATLDEKNRLRIPKNFRMKLGEDFMLCAGTGGSIFVLTEKEFEAMLSSVEDVAISSLEKQDALRKIMSRLYKPEEDAQFRFILPSELKKHSKIKKKVVLLGMMNRIEIWAEEVYEEKYLSDSVDIDEAFKALSDAGL